MFYSEKTKVIDHNLTYLHSQKVFTGQYWDEFSLTSSLVPDQGEVLMLGLSLGGGIRPILSGGKKLNLTCIDWDRKSVENCKQFYHQYFPEIKFDTHSIDAKLYLKKCNKKFDAIWFDIYESDGYSPLAFDKQFINLIKDCLTETGVFLINSYGLPNHFSPLKLGGIQNQFAIFLKSQFNFLSSIPYRRNLTFIAGSTSPTIYEGSPNHQLNAIDQFTYKFNQKRITQIIKTTIKSDSSLISRNHDGTEIDMKFTSIDKQMREQWDHLRLILLDVDIKLNSNKEILDIIQNPFQCENVLKYLLNTGSALPYFIPILAAGESHIQNIDVNWLFDWTNKNHAILKENLGHTGYLEWLTQLWAMVIHPSGKFKNFYFMILALMK